MVHRSHLSSDGPKETRRACTRDSDRSCGVFVRESEWKRGFQEDLTLEKKGFRPVSFEFGENGFRSVFRTSMMSYEGYGKTHPRPIILQET